MSISMKEKMMRMYVELNGELDTSTGCNLVAYEHEFDQNDDEFQPLDISEDALVLFKDDCYCWHVTKNSLLFDYLTKDWI